MKPKHPGYEHCHLVLVTHIWSQSLQSSDQVVEPHYRGPTHTLLTRPWAGLPFCALFIASHNKLKPNWSEQWTLSGEFYWTWIWGFSLEPVLSVKIGVLWIYDLQYILAANHCPLVIVNDWAKIMGCGCEVFSTPEEGHARKKWTSVLK